MWPASCAPWMAVRRCCGAAPPSGSKSIRGCPSSRAQSDQPGVFGMTLGQVEDVSDELRHGFGINGEGPEVIVAVGGDDLTEDGGLVAEVRVEHFGADPCVLRDVVDPCAGQAVFSELGAGRREDVSANLGRRPGHRGCRQGRVPLPICRRGKRGHRNAARSAVCPPRHARTRGWDRRCTCRPSSPGARGRPSAPRFGGERRRDHRGESWGPARRPSWNGPSFTSSPHRARRVRPSRPVGPAYCCDARSDKPGEVRLGPIAANSHPVRRHPGATDPTARWEADTLMRPPRVATNICSHRDTT